MTVWTFSTRGRTSQTYRSRRFDHYKARWRQFYLDPAPTWLRSRASSKAARIWGLAHNSSS